MDTPIVDFVRDYAQRQTVRLHMPGHKGRAVLGPEPYDITEVCGADALYEADGIIHRSEQNAAALFGAARTLYSAEGSSQCIRAMVHLAARRASGRPWFLAARNAHKAFLYALALADADVTWLWPAHTDSICACAVTAQQVEDALRAADTPPAAVYVTSPDYLGNRLPLDEIAAVCHRYGTLLLVDNAHGAYLRFLPESRHPLDLGADMCCDSAHKTLPVLTGGAYLHIAPCAPADLAPRAKAAMEIFGSTSPSYLILASLDRCNRALAEDFRAQLAEAVRLTAQTRAQLIQNGWEVLSGEPLKLTLHCPAAFPGQAMAQHLRAHNIECEYADSDFLVLMTSGSTTAGDLSALVRALGQNAYGPAAQRALSLPQPARVLSVREALFAPQAQIPTQDALGRVAAAPVVSCPPAIPIVVSGERIDAQTQALLLHYGADRVAVIK